MTIPTNGPYTPPQHGDKMNGHTFDAHDNEWKLDSSYDPAAHSAYYMGHGGGSNKKPIKTKTAIWAVCGAAAAVIGLITIANLASEDRGTVTSDTSSSSIVASTPDDRFVEAYKDAGFTNRRGDAGILDGGYTICDGLDAGLTERQLVQAGYQGNQETNGTMERSDVQQVVDMATQYLCPEYR